METSDPLEVIHKRTLKNDVDEMLFGSNLIVLSANALVSR
jgi:hypothetical protein